MEQVLGQGNLPGEVARNASDMYSNNLVNLLLNSNPELRL